MLEQLKTKIGSATYVTSDLSAFGCVWMLAICVAGKKLTTVVHAFYVDAVPIYVCTASSGAP